MNLPFNILVLCTGNSARSLMGEALFNHYAQGRWRAFSAGSQPKGAAHPMALQTLQTHGISTMGLRSKSWDEFAVEPGMSVVITVCDNAANEVCPVWPGTPARVHWGMPDPAAAPTEQLAQSFATTYRTLLIRISRLNQRDMRSLTATQLNAELQALAAVY